LQNANLQFAICNLQFAICNSFWASGFALLFSVSFMVGNGWSAEDDAIEADLQVLKKAGIASDSEGLLNFFRRRTLTEPDRLRIEGLIRDLGNNEFAARQRASAKLLAEGARAVPLLKHALTAQDLEIRRRAEDCLKSIGGQDAGTNVVASAARVVGVRRPAGAAEVLLNYFPYAEVEGVSEDVLPALKALAVRDGQPDPVLAAALTDKDPIRRRAAAEALCQPAAASLRPAIRQLLRDPDATVRLYVALALAGAKEKDAVPVVIDLLAELPPSQGWRAEEYLCRLAGEQAPAVSLGQDADSRRKCRDAWAAWWREHADKIDLARLQQTKAMIGYTLVILLDIGQILELDRANQVRWQVDHLGYPLDAQMLPDNRFLVAEHDANRVTERNTKGEILWQYGVEEPIMAQRLPNGNTFIASQDNLIEVDRAGRQVLKIERTSSEIMKARKLPGGDIVYASFKNQIVRLDPTGREIAKFPAFVSIWGGRLDVLPNGNVLVPEHDRNRVVEYDPKGKVVWEAAIQGPIAAVRLPNGHTLVTFMTKHQGVELDRAGKVVWEYSANTRVTRLFRR
jgi:HEAT repeat protein